MMNYDIFPLIETTLEYQTEKDRAAIQQFFWDNRHLVITSALRLKEGIIESRVHAKSRALYNIIPTIREDEHLFTVLIFVLVQADYGDYTAREGTNAFELRLCLEGSGTIEYRGKKYILRPGDGFFISCEEPHCYYANEEGWTFTQLYFIGTACQQFFNEFTSGGSVVFRKDQFPACEHLQYQLLQATQRVTPHMQYRISYCLDHLLTELLCSKFDSNANQPDTNAILSVIAYLQQHYQDKIIFGDLAARFGWGRSAFFDTFRRYTGATPAEFLMIIRINQAKILLRNSNLSIEEICEETGFSDSSHFSRSFKKHTGITPLKYRKESAPTM